VGVEVLQRISRGASIVAVFKRFTLKSVLESNTLKIVFPSVSSPIKRLCPYRSKANPTPNAMAKFLSSLMGISLKKPKFIPPEKPFKLTLLGTLVSKL
jgi:hypothetical protein